MSLARRFFFAVLFSTVLAHAAATQQRPSDEAIGAARTLVEASGAAAQFDQFLPIFVAQMTKTFAQLAPDRAKEIREVMAELTTRFTARKGELIDQIAVIYAKSLSLEDLQEITRFYQSGAGRRMVVAQPDIMRQATIAGQNWGQQIGAEIDAEMRRELKKRGIDL